MPMGEPVTFFPLSFEHFQAISLELMTQTHLFLWHKKHNGKSEDRYFVLAARLPPIASSEPS